MVVAVAHYAFHHRADLCAGLLADDLPLGAGLHGLDQVAVSIGNFGHHVGLHQVAAVDCGRHRRDGLQGGDLLGLTEAGTGQLHRAEALLIVVLHVLGLTGQVNAGGLGKAEGFEIVEEGFCADLLAQLHIVNVAAVAQSGSQILHTMGSIAGTAVLGAGYVKAAVAAEAGGRRGRAGIQAHGAGNNLEH